MVGGEGHVHSHRIKIAYLGGGGMMELQEQGGASWGAHSETARVDVGPTWRRQGETARQNSSLRQGNCATNLEERRQSSLFEDALSFYSGKTSADLQFRFGSAVWWPTRLTVFQNVIWVYGLSRSSSPVIVFRAHRIQRLNTEIALNARLLLLLVTSTLCLYSYPISSY